ncbi:FAD-binding protein [Turicimonas muris]|uniref:FAD-binding protein n=2 Tax=Turicimonas muris TaxID=1796652 RepID=UPI0020CC3B4C|nr:FAD-binding protein [Turicimonas muris]
MPSTQKVGVQFKPGIYQIYGGLWPRCRNPVGQSGGDYIKACTQYAKKIGLPILTSHKVTSIIREKPDSGRVLGVEVDLGNGKKEYWKANKGVVAAAGGFAANPEMCAFFDPRLTKLNTTNQPGSTGEVLKAIQGINGLAVGMDYIPVYPLDRTGVQAHRRHLPGYRIHCLPQ